MRKIIAACLTLFGSTALLCAPAAGQQQPQPSTTLTVVSSNRDDVNRDEARVALAEQPVAHDAGGQVVLAARLRDATPAGTPDAPLRNARLVVENRGTSFYNYVTGWATFYDAGGVRCGEGLFSLGALAPAEAVETDLPNLRLTCTPATWRLAANTLLARGANAATPAQAATTSDAASPIAPVAAGGTTTGVSATVPPLRIDVNGEVLPVQINRPIEVRVGRETVRIVISAGPAN